jgi:polygalacturonase
MMFDVTAYGAPGDGKSPATEAFEAAIVAAHQAGGGTVVVPAGTYRSGPLRLRSHVRLHLEPGAVLQFSDRFEDYPVVFTRFAGFMCHCLQPCLFGDGLEDVAITGRGRIDGQGAAWWREFRSLRESASPTPHYAFEKQLAELNASVDVSGAVWDEWGRQFLRPPLVQLKDCRRVLIEGVTIGHSPFWNTHLLFCEDVTVHDVRFVNPPDAPNGDGLDIDSSARVRISDCSFDVGDDCLCLKSGIDGNGREVGRPTEDVVIANCTMYRGHGGVVLGSDTAGGIRRVTVSNCVFNGTDRGIRIKSRRGRGGCVQDLRISNLIMSDVLCPLVVNLYYTCGAQGAQAERASAPDAAPVGAETPSIRNVSLSGVTARGASVAAASLLGLPESPIRHVTLSDVEIETCDRATPAKAAMSFHCAPTSGAGLSACHVEDLSLRNVRIAATRGPALRIRNSARVEIAGGGFSSEDTDDAIDR